MQIQHSIMGWGSGALDVDDEILDLIDKDKARRLKARRSLLKQKPGHVSREILWKLMNAILAKDFHIQDAERDVEKVFMAIRRNIPDHGIPCKLSDILELNSVKEVTFKKFTKYTTKQQKKTALWVKDGANQRIEKAKIKL